MEATKKVGGPDPSGPQGHPSAGCQQLGGGFRGSLGPWIRSGSLFFKQGLSLSPEAIMDGVCVPASQVHTLEPSHQPLQDPAQVSSPYSHGQASHNVPRYTSTGQFASPIMRAQQHLVMDDGTLHLPACVRNNSPSDHHLEPSCPQLQVLIGREIKTPAKVLVGWGKGPCHADQTAPMATRKSRWIPYLLPGEVGTAEGQGPLLVPVQAPAQDQGQGPGLAQAPALATTLLAPAAAAPAQAAAPAVDMTPKPAAVGPYTYTLKHLTDRTAVTKTPSEDFVRKCGNQWPVLLEPPTAAAPGEDKDRPKEESPAPPPASEAVPVHGQEQEAGRWQEPPKEPDTPAEKPLVHSSSPDNPKPGPEAPAAIKSKRSNQDICSLEPDKQSPSAGNSSYSGAAPPDQKQPEAPPPTEVVHIPASGAPTCQLQDTVEDQVLVFDMATGSSRMGLLCHDPTGSRAVLVGLMPNHPTLCVPENVLSTRPLAKPMSSSASNHSNWSTTPMLSSPVPSSLSSGSYREVALVPKEARLNLESRDTLGTETPIRVGMFTGPVPLGTPLRFVERIQPHVPDPSWPKPDAEKNERSSTIWMLEPSMMPDAPVAQPKKLKWMNSELATPVDTQVVPGPLLQGDTAATHPDSPQTKDAGQVPLDGQILNGQTLLAGQLPLNEQGSPAGQPPSTMEPPLPARPPLPVQTPLVTPLSLNRQASFSRKLLTTTEPTLLRGLLTSITSGEHGQVPAQEGESWGPPAHMEVFRVPLTSEETCIYLNRDKVGISHAQGSGLPRFSSWPPGSCPGIQEERLSLITFSAPGTGYKFLPMAMVGPEAQTRQQQFRVIPEDIARSAVVSHFGLLRGTCYEVVSTVDTVPGHSPVVPTVDTVPGRSPVVPTVDTVPGRSPVSRHRMSGPYQNMAAVVIDTGTGFTKCGLAGEDHILSVVPSQVQLLQHPAQGQPRYAVPENQEGSFPVLNRGVVSDWDALEVLWQHLFYCRLGVQPEELAVLVADSPISPRTNREKVAEILFERFHVPAMQTVHQALLTLYAYGRTTGLVLGSGHGTSYVAPILTGDLAPLDTYRLDVAGTDLTNYLAQLLQTGGRSAPKAGLLSQIKEACCYVAMDMAAEMERTQAQAGVDFMLPDKQVITLGSERFCCPEALFQPSLLGLNQPGLPQLALLSISKLEAKQQEQLLANVVLDGGSTLLSGLPERLQQDLGPGATVLGSPHRAVAAWLGGSIMACRDSFQSLWLSRREYEEEGPWAIYKYQL